jgi:LPXTG-motif cell wall-anchored protein
VDLAGATTLHGPVSATVTEPTAVTLDDFAASGQPSARHALWIPAAGLVLVALATLITRRRRIVERQIRPSNLQLPQA